MVGNWVKVMDTLFVVFFVIILQLFHYLIGLTIHGLEWFCCVVSCVPYALWKLASFLFVMASQCLIRVFALRASIDMSHIAHVNTCLFMISSNSVKHSECF